MKGHKTLEPCFVKSVPATLEEGVAYVSMEYASVIHLCCCGCGNEVVTPLSPTDWQLYFDGDSITLYPSIGNWGFHCRSHYWIRGNRIEHAPQWTDHEIEEGRAYDRWLKKHYDTSKKSTSKSYQISKPCQIEDEIKVPEGLWKQAIRFVKGCFK